MWNLLLISSVLITFASTDPDLDRSFCPQEVTGNLPQNLKTTRKNFDTIVATEAQARTYFDLVKQPRFNIPFDYVVDGCDMRAFFMSKALYETSNIKSFRVSIAATTGHLMADTNKTLEGFVEASHHTATAICVKKDNGVFTYILDPSLQSGPVPVSTWIDSLTTLPWGKIPYKMTLSNMYSLDPRKRPRNFKRNLAQAEKERAHSIAELQSGKVQIGPIRSRNRASIAN